MRKPFTSRRILIHSNYHPDNHGGIEKVVSSMITIARGLYREIDCICGGDRSSTVADGRGLTIHVRRILVKVKGASFLALGNLLLLARAMRCSTVVFQEPYPTLWPAMYVINRLMRKRVIVLIHADPAAGRRVKAFYDRLRALVFRNALCVTTSPQLLRAVERISSPTKLVVPLAIEDAYPGELEPVDVPGRYVLYMGRLADYKGIEYLLEAAALDRSVQYVIAGTGPLGELVAGRIVEDGLSNIRFLNFRFTEGQKQALLEGCSFVVFPSTSENEAFGLVQLEAMRAARAIVNTELGSGVNFVAPHGDCAITVPPRDARALCQAVNQLWTDPDLASRLGAAGRRRFLTEFAQSSFTARWTRLLSPA